MGQPELRDRLNQHKAPAIAAAYHGAVISPPLSRWRRWQIHHASPACLRRQRQTVFHRAGALARASLQQWDSPTVNALCDKALLAGFVNQTGRIGFTNSWAAPSANSKETFNLLSLINDALKRAKQTQQENPPTTPALEFRRVEPGQKENRRTTLLVVGLALVVDR